MKILMITPTYWEVDNLKGGAERYVKELSNGLALLEEVEKIDIVTFSRQYERTTIISNKQSLKIYKTRFIDENQSNPRVTLKSIFNVRYDIFYIHQFNTWLSFFFICIGKILRKKIVLTDHNGGGRCYNYKLKLDRCIDLMLAGSRQHSEEMNLEIPKTRFIYGGVDQNLFIQKTTHRNRDVLFVGRLKEIKGLVEISKILTEIKSVGKITFIFPNVESEEEKSIYNILLKLEKETSWNVELKENLTQDDLVNEYNNHSWLILPSLNVDKGKESIGLVVLEALSCGCGALVSDFCGIKELSSQETNGFFRVEKDWEKFFEDGYRDRVISSDARKWVLENGTWSTVTKKVFNALVSDL